MVSVSIREFAASQGYDGVSFTGAEWNGWQIYRAYIAAMLPKENEPAPGTGYPHFILEKDGKIRWADSLDETFAIMDALYPDDEEETDVAGA